MGRVIGITGLAGSGKSTVARILENYGYTRYAFADPLKKSVQAIFGFSDEQLWGDLKEVVDPRWGVTPRRVLQHIGTEHHRDNPVPGIQGSIWIKCFENAVDANPTQLFVVEDVRFVDEANAIHKMGGIVIRVVRPGILAGSHASETSGSLIAVNATVVNDGSFDDLKRRVIRALGGIDM